jgi:hypothetical protein
VSKSSLDEGYNCVVREDGVMVAEGDIPSGTYQVSAWWAGRAKRRERERAEVRQRATARMRGAVRTHGRG